MSGRQIPYLRDLRHGMNRLKYLVLGLLLHLSGPLLSQMVIGPDTLTGHEWIRYGQPYGKFTIAEDGVYRVYGATLTAAGYDPTLLEGGRMRLYSLGKEVPIYVTTNGQFSQSDYIEFYGRKNRGEFDQYLFRHPETDMLNPDHSLYTDERPYFLTIDTFGVPLRVREISAAPTLEASFVLNEEIVAFASALNDPYFPLSGAGAISYSSYQHGEGFAKGSENNSVTNISANGRSLAGPDARLRIRFATTNYGIHTYALIFNGIPLDTLTLRDLDFVDTEYAVPLAAILYLNTVALNAANTQSRHALVRIELVYAHQLSSDGVDRQHLLLPPSPDGLSVILDGFSFLDATPVAYSTDGEMRAKTSIAGPDQIRLDWPATVDTTAIFMADPGTAIQVVSQLRLLTFTDISADNTDYIVITHPALMPSGTASDYVQYRRSAAGGGYDAKAYSILDVYDLFGYGIQKHPQAIRNFIEFAHRYWPKAEMVFLIGRGIEYNRSRIPGESWETSFFVPTFGRPGSDQLLAATTWDLVPRYPVGRLAVISPEGIASYLDKVKAHDAGTGGGQTLEAKRWIKNVMHIGGGKTSSEQSDFAYTLADLGEQLDTSAYGANIRFFQKTSTDIIGEAQSAKILALLREGCGLINYLGHSGTTTFEFNISEPAEWNNTGRYPVFSAMGCSAGQIHGPLMSLSDNYVQTPGEGAIAFISGSGSQYAAALTEWARPWYEYLGTTGYGAPLGESVLYGLRALGKYIDPNLTSANQYRFLLEQQTLQGDPALRLNPLPGPDYLLHRSAVRIEPGLLSTALDSFDLHFSLFNIGRNLQQDVLCAVVIRRPDGARLEVWRDTVHCRRYENLVHLRLPLPTDGQAGVFRLLIEVDPDNGVAESPSPEAESNNRLTDNLGVPGIPLFVSGDQRSAVYPPSYAIVNDIVPVITAGGTNAFAPGEFVVFEIDTSGLFDSPLRKRMRFLGDAATVQWSPDIDWTPGEVYYWRVSADSLSPGQGYVWDKRSFLYAPDSPDGWNQSHFHQWTDNSLYQLLADSLRQRFTFATKAKDFRILNRYHDFSVGLIPQVVIDGVIKAEFFTGFRPHPVHVFVVAIDSTTGDFLYNPNPGLYGSFNPLSFDAPCFAYRTDTPESRQALINFVKEVIPAGHYVFFYTYQRTPYPDYFPETWADDEGAFGQSLFTLIEEQVPTSAIRTLEVKGSVPYIVLFRKDRGGIAELIAADTTETISMIPDLRSSLATGRLRSPLIGPAQTWQEILWSGKSPEIDTAAENRVAAWAYTRDGQDSIEVSPALPADTVLGEALALTHPYLRLILETKDSVTYTPLQPDHWRVLYAGVPELAIRKDLGFSFQSDTLFQGDTMRLFTYIENLSPYPVDSVRLLLQLTNESNETFEMFQWVRAIPGQGAVPVSFSRSTSDLAGDYQLVLTINPGGEIAELDLRNNSGRLTMHVRRDEVNPLLEVTFDGFRIRDGDLVSAYPVIAITLADENLRRPLTDTAAFDLQLQFPSAFAPEPVWFSAPWVEFIPAPDTGMNIARVILQPALLEDGYYTLIVNARDASGNAAGDIDYRISFRVDHREAISYIVAYPNPFRHSTRFLYTLSGKGNPEDYGIEIVHISGVKVREIPREELGPLPAGAHPTGYEWAGDDADGRPLPSGVYFYRLVARDANGRPYPLLVVQGNRQSTEKGWGKLVLIR